MRSYRGFLRYVLSCAPKPKSETLPIEQAAGRVVLESLRARVNDPAERRSAMDGYAVRTRDLEGVLEVSPVVLRAAGVSAAGPTARLRLRQGHAHRIMTGAPLPDGADAIVPVERVEVDGEEVRFFRQPRVNEFVRHPGENFRKNAVLVKAGAMLRPQEIGVCVTAGIRTVKVARLPRVGVLSTGDELVSPGKALRRGEVYDSNRPMILALVRDTGAIPVNLGTVSDRPRALERAVSRARRECDFLITIGGVSMGDFDVVKQFLRTVKGVELVKIAMRPAKPQAFGRPGRLFWYGLPGNPVSAMVAFDRFVRPLLYRSIGHRSVFRSPRTGQCATKLKKPHNLVEFVRAFAYESNGQWYVAKVGPEGSSNLRSMVNANAFIILPEDTRGVEPGSHVAFELFSDPPSRASI